MHEYAMLVRDVVGHWAIALRDCIFALELSAVFVCALPAIYRSDIVTRSRARRQGREASPELFGRALHHLCG